MDNKFRTNEEYREDTAKLLSEIKDNQILGYIYLIVNDVHEEVAQCE